MNTIVVSRGIVFWLIVSCVAVSLPAAEPDVKNQRPAPLFDNLGSHHHPITTKSKQAQRYFDQGLILLYAFNHAEAIRAFEAAARLDPACAMPWWGIACAHGPNINAPMADEAVPKAWAALEKAIALKPKASARERAYIDALAKRYRPEPVKDRSELDRAYAEAMRELAREHPDDLDAATLFAEAVMDTMPWDYWTEDQQPKPATTEVLQTLGRVLARDPRHPGANHLYIHAVEAGPTPELGLPAADRLVSIAPGAGHLVHMPSHIYVRVGQYADALKVNYEAAKADESYIASCRAQGFYPGLYYPHNVHFIWFAASIEGRSAESIAAARKVSQYAKDLRCGAAEGPRLRHLPLLAYARFGRWDDILKEPDPPKEQVFDRAATHYARGLARIGKRQLDRAAKELAALEAIAAGDEVKKLDSPYLPATGIVNVSRHVLAGKLAAARGENDTAARRLEQAVAAYDALPYMEPAFWYYPVRQSLAAVLIKQGRAAEAEKLFRRTLDDWPRNGWSLYGLEQALRNQDKTAAADSVAREFQEAWKNADVKPDLEWF